MKFAGSINPEDPWSRARLVRPLVSLLIISLAACQPPTPRDTPEGQPAETEATLGASEHLSSLGAQGGALRLPIDPTVPPHTGALPDRSKSLKMRQPWDNYRAYDPLTTSFTNAQLATKYAAFKADFVGTLMRSTTIDFELIHHFYTDGFISQDNRAEQVTTFKAWIDAQPEETRDGYRANLVTALFHIGFEDEALSFVNANLDARWMKDSWDANAYTGRALFRWGRYAEALPFLERAVVLDESGWNRLWLKLARLAAHDAVKPSPSDDAKDDPEEAQDIFPFGAHMGPDDAALFPFRDRSAEWGVGSWALAGSVAFFDFDNDTHLDMVQTSSNFPPEFYRFKPGVGFERTTMAPLTDLANLVPGALAADFDNDGFTDLYFASAAWFGAGTNRLLKNDGGEGFIDLSHLGDCALNDQKSVSSAALDFDRDGLVDIVVTGMAGGMARLLHNQGDMVFKDVTEKSGVKSASYNLGVHITAGDVNNDGWSDIFINGFAYSQLFINQQDGTFKNEAVERGIVKGDLDGFATWMFDYDNDGDLDIAAAVFAMPDMHFAGGFGAFPVEHLSKPRPSDRLWHPSLLYRNDGEGHFTEVGSEAGIISAAVMGGQFIDMELDGRLDIILGPGSHPLHNIQPLFLYRNDGGDRFTNVVPYSNPRFWGKNHGMAFADVDRDGDPDLFVNNGGVMSSDQWRDMFLENTTVGKTWLHIGLIGTESNRSAIGARATVAVAGRTLMQEKAAGQGFGGTNSPYLIFGLDDATEVDNVTIRWPNGKQQRVPALAANQAIIVTEGSDVFRRIY